MEFEIQGTNQRFRSSRRLRHEAEVEVFKKRLGNLEIIRQGLGLRPSQICEILKVHPSAWTRWVRDGGAPPHVYQMIEWYIELLSWRGQNSPHAGSPVIPKKIRKESPETYLPSPEPFAPQQQGLSREKYIEKKVFITILVISSLFQLLLMLGFYLVLKS